MKQYINIFSEERMCEYKGRRYFVRDNGAIYRQSKEDGKIRKWDEEWTFGKFDLHTGYMLIGQERVHRIVCWAYYGEPVGDRNIVDHIDTNRSNNRPENLRWVTKLENTLNNPITRAKVELICGSIEAFLNNPTLLYGHESENPNFGWMRAVTKEEGQQSLKRWSEWATWSIEERRPQGRSIGEWLYKKDVPSVNRYPSNRSRYIGPYNSWAEHLSAVELENQRIHKEQYGLKESLTPGALQLNWKVKTAFPLCPAQLTSSPLQDYLKNLKGGDVFCYNDVYKSFVFKAGLSDDCSTLAVITTNDHVKGTRGFVLCTVTYKNNLFIHENQHSFFEKVGAEKYFTLALGHEWTGGDVMDDFC